MTKQAFTIRAATIDDCEIISEFNTHLAAETEGKALLPEVIRAGVKTLLSDDRHGRYFLAVQGETVIGQMMHTREWSDWRNGEIWWLQSVYVRADFRNQGVFRALYRHLEELATNSSDVIGLRLYVENHNRKAQDAYLSLGMKDASYAVMERIFRNDV